MLIFQAYVHVGNLDLPTHEVDATALAHSVVRTGNTMPPMCTAPFSVLLKRPLVPTAGVQVHIFVYERVTDFPFYERFVHFGIHE